MKKILLLLLLLLPLLFQAQGLADWEHETPGGNWMGDEGAGTFIQKQNFQRIMGVTRWYFFHNHIIGCQQHGFFITEESTGSTTEFQAVTDWKHYQQVHHLVPQVWTRWYSDDWTVGRGIGSSLLVSWAGWATLMGAKEHLSKSASKRQGPRKVLRLIVVAVVLFGVALWTLLAYYPQSV